MSTGLTRQALRRHRRALLGPAATQCVGATVIAAMVTTGTSLAAAPLAPAQRRAVESADVPSAVVAFALIAVYLSILLVGVTMSSAIAQQGRDIALLRAVGATPGQVRRSVALQAAIVAVPASVLGYLLGLLAGWGWVAALVWQGVLPDAVRFAPEPAVLPMVLGILVGTSVVGALVAAIRPARVRPATALTETATGRPRGLAVRTGLGLLLVAAGAVLSAILARLPAEQAFEAGFFVMLALCVGVGMLGPVILGAATRVVAPVVRLAGGSGQLALDTVAARSRSLSGALVPLVLAVAFATVKVASHTTAARVTGTTEDTSAVWLDYSGTAVYCAFAAVAGLNTLITVIVGRRRDLAVMQLAGATRQRLAAVLICEAGIVVTTVVGLAAGVAVVTLAPLLHTGLGTWLPYLPPGFVIAAVLATTGLVVAGTVAPALVLTRRPAIEVAGASG